MSRLIFSARGKRTNVIEKQIMLPPHNVSLEKARQGSPASLPSSHASQSHGDGVSG